MQTARRHLILAGIGSSLLCFSSLSRAVSGNTLNVELLNDTQGFRFTIHSQDRLSVRQMLLRNKKPFRFVLDLDGVTLTHRLSAQIRALSLGVAAPIVSIRPGQFSASTMRIVFDLKPDVAVRLTQPPQRLSRGHQVTVQFSSGPAQDLLGDIIRETSSTTPPPQKAVSKKEPAKRKTETLIVVVDPGHGGADPGAVGKRRTYEKHVALSIARKLTDQINAQRGMRAIMTRKNDVFLPLAKRAGIAVKNHAHLFISIHADAWTRSDARGSSVFTLSTNGSSSLQARWLAQTQNRADEIGGMAFRDVQPILRSTVVDMLAETKLRYGLHLGSEILDELSKLGPLHKSTVESAEFAVLKAQAIPSILVETGFISNPEDERRLRDDRHQTRVAKAIFNGMVSAVKKDPSLLRHT